MIQINKLENDKKNLQNDIDNIEVLIIKQRNENKEYQEKIASIRKEQFEQTNFEINEAVIHIIYLHYNYILLKNSDPFEELKKKILMTEAKISGLNKAQERDKRKTLDHGKSIEKILSRNNFSSVYNNSAILNKIVEDVHEIKDFLNVSNMNLKIFKLMIEKKRRKFTCKRRIL